MLRTYTESPGQTVPERDNRTANGAPAILHTNTLVRTHDTETPQIIPNNKERGHRHRAGSQRAYTYPSGTGSRASKKQRVDGRAQPAELPHHAYSEQMPGQLRNVQKGSAQQPGD